MKAVTSLCLVAIAWSSIAAAQPSPVAAAEAEFEKGLAAKKAGHWQDACTAFEASQKLDPQLGTLYDVGECNQQLGKLASAWTAFSELAQRDTNAGRRAHSADLARALEPRLTKILLRVSPQVAGVAVALNGVPATSFVGIETPVDPGTYDVTAQAAGYRAFESKVAVTAEGQTVTVDIALQPAPHDATPPPVVTAPAPAPSSGTVVAPAPMTVPAAPAPAEHSHRLVYAITGVSLGAALFIGGGITGDLANGKWSDAKALCPTGTCATTADTASANALVDAARTRATISDVLFAAGVVAAGVGIYFFVAPHHHETATALRIAPAPGGITLLGGF